MPRADVAAGERALDEVWEAALADLDELVRVRSVSAPHADAAGLSAGAANVAALLERAGARSVQRLGGTAEAPCVLADFSRADGADDGPAVLLYAHYDVVGAGAEAAWASAPFETHERNGRLYGRGVSDAKGCVLVHAVAAATAARGARVKVLIEGDEEAGSAGLEELLVAHAEELAADAVVVLDGANLLDRAILTDTLRGFIDVELHLRTLHQNEHSGVHGGALPDAVSALARLLASFHDADGAVAVEGLRGGGERDFPMDEQAYREAAGLLDGVRLIGRGPLGSRLWDEPALCVTAIDAPATDAAAHELVAAAAATVAVRLAPADDVRSAEQALRRHVERHTPWGAHVELAVVASAPPVRVAGDGPAFEAMRGALRDAWEAPPAVLGDGSSIPVVQLLAERYPDAELLITGVADPRSRCHGPDESVSLQTLRRSCLAEVLFLQRYLGERPAAG